MNEEQMMKFLGDVAKYLLDEMSGADFRRFAQPVVDVLATAMLEHSKAKRNPAKHVAGGRCTCPTCRSPKMPIDDMRWN